ncbi:BCCT family transporter [uncultured Serinicoccus sp.]|uniref:BCCT family transporter n=1 Tax=uncultured Serinicoccus sp. TaxID=735514 RepID=UPI0026225452|nr:BCCT family transporter [uncultured Serinicoccus sp.]
MGRVLHREPREVQHGSHGPGSPFGWVYILATTLFIAFLLFLALSRFGHIRLGKDHERPEFTTVSWLAMLFSAGMGVGLVFYGVAEPMSHLASPPLGIGEPMTIEAGQRAMQYTFFHWGLHAWAIYGLVGLALAYFQFRKGASGLISSAFYPLLGDRVHGPIGWTIDVLAIFVTALGVATSFGISATQMNSGLNYVFGLPEGLAMQVVIIVVVMCLFLTSALSGLDKGIKYLSNLNMILMGAVMLFVLAVGPRLFVLDTFVASIGNYLQNFLAMSFTSGAFVGEEGSAWLEGWTLYYWAWWMMWVMWVGTFIARVSRGRTIREFVAGVLLVPSVLSFLWFSVLGGTAINEELFGGGGISEAVAESLDTALFVTFDQFPGAAFISLVAILLIASFLITSADSAAFVLAMLSTNGDQNPTARMKVLWGVLIAVFAFVLLLAGGLQAVQQVAIITGVPFTILLIGMAVSLYKSVVDDSFPGLRPHLPGADRRAARRAHAGPSGDAEDQVPTG